MSKIIYTTENYRLVKHGLHKYSSTVWYYVEMLDKWTGEWMFTCDRETAGKITSKKEAIDLIDRLKKLDNEIQALKEKLGLDY